MALKSLWFRYYIFRVTPKSLEKNNPDQRADEVLQEGVSLNLNLKITSPSPITGQLCIDFNQLPNQKIFETSDLKECQTKALEKSNEYPEDLFCIVQIPESYITGKRGIVEQFAWCVPFVKSNNQTGYCVIPDLILEIYHSYGVVVSNPNYNLAFIPDSNVLTKEQLEEGVKNIDRKRLFVVNDFNDATIYFRPHTFSKAIFEKEIDMRYDAKKKKVLGSFSQKTANYDDMSIKDVCLPIKVDRLGNIIELDCIS